MLLHHFISHSKYFYKQIFKMRYDIIRCLHPMAKTSQSERSICTTVHIPIIFLTEHRLMINCKCKLSMRLFGTGLSYIWMILYVKAGPALILSHFNFFSSYISLFGLLHNITSRAFNFRVQLFDIYYTLNSVILYCKIQVQLVTAILVFFNFGY